MEYAVVLLLALLPLFPPRGGGPPGPGMRPCYAWVFLFALAVAVGPSWATGARAIGMGSAFLAISDDENATFFNIAGLSQLDKTLYQASAQVLDRDAFRRDSFSYVGKLYDTTDKKKLTLEEYLESDYNFKAEVEKVSNYAWAFGIVSEKRSLDLNLRSGLNPATEDRRTSYFLGFSTRFPIAERLTRRPELYGGVRMRFQDIDRSIPALGVHAGQDALDLDIHWFYRANSRFNLGSVINSVLSGSTHDVFGARAFSTTVSSGISYYYGEKRDTILAADVTNVFNASRAQRPKLRVGAERQFLDNDFVFRIGSDDGLLTLGVGVRFWDDFRLDYAFERGQVIDEHTVSMRLVF